MGIRSFFFIAVTLCAATAQQVGRQRTTSTEMMGILNLPDGSKFKTTLYNMKVIGQLRTTKKLRISFLREPLVPNATKTPQSTFIRQVTVR
jgi:hypothetical protein